MDVLTCGGFDPLHIGHLRLLQHASLLGDRLIVVLNDDAWLTRKKGSPFMRQEERLEIISALRCVDHAFILHTQADHVADAIMQVRPQIFAKGGDRRSPADLPRAEFNACQEVGATIMFGIGGDKIQSSSWLVDGHHARL